MMTDYCNAIAALFAEQDSTDAAGRIPFIARREDDFTLRTAVRFVSPISTAEKAS